MPHWQFNSIYLFVSFEKNLYLFTNINVYLSERVTAGKQNSGKYLLKSFKHF